MTPDRSILHLVVKHMLDKLYTRLSLDMSADCHTFMPKDRLCARLSLEDCIVWKQNVQNV